MGWNKTKIQEYMHFHSGVREENNAQLQQHTLKKQRPKKKIIIIRCDRLQLIKNMPKNKNHSINHTAVKTLTQACSGFTRAGDLHPSRTVPGDSANQRKLREPQIHMLLDLENINISFLCSRYCSGVEKQR